MEPVKISVYGIVGNSLCVSAKDGEKVYKKIREVLEKGKKVELSFLNVQLLTAAFLNTAIGSYIGISLKKKLKTRYSYAIFPRPGSIT